MSCSTYKNKFSVIASPLKLIRLSGRDQRGIINNPHRNILSANLKYTHQNILKGSNWSRSKMLFFGNIFISIDGQSCPKNTNWPRKMKRITENNWKIKIELTLQWAETEIISLPPTIPPHHLLGRLVCILASEHCSGASALIVHGGIIIKETGRVESSRVEFVDCTSKRGIWQEDSISFIVIPFGSTTTTIGWKVGYCDSPTDCRYWNGIQEIG